MDVTTPTPRVNAAQLKGFVGKKVRLVGAVAAGAGGAGAALEAADGGRVAVVQVPGSSYNTKYVEVVGRVTDEATIQEEEYTCFGDNFGALRGPAARERAEGEGERAADRARGAASAKLAARSNLSASPARR